MKLIPGIAVIAFETRLGIVLRYPSKRRDVYCAHSSIHKHRNLAQPFDSGNASSMSA